MHLYTYTYACIYLFIKLRFVAFVTFFFVEMIVFFSSSYGHGSSNPNCPPLSGRSVFFLLILSLAPLVPACSFFYDEIIDCFPSIPLHLIVSTLTRCF